MSNLVTAHQPAIVALFKKKINLLFSWNLSRQWYIEKRNLQWLMCNTHTHTDVHHLYLALPFLSVIIHYICKSLKPSSF